MPLGQPPEGRCTKNPWDNRVLRELSTYLCIPRRFLITCEFAHVNTYKIEQKKKNKKSNCNGIKKECSRIGKKNKYWRTSWPVDNKFTGNTTCWTDRETGARALGHDCIVRRTNAKNAMFFLFILLESYTTPLNGHVNRWIDDGSLKKNTNNGRLNKKTHYKHTWRTYLVVRVYIYNILPIIIHVGRLQWRQRYRR